MNPTQAMAVALIVNSINLIGNHSGWATIVLSLNFIGFFVCVYTDNKK